MKPSFRLAALAAGLALGTLTLPAQAQLRLPAPGAPAAAPSGAPSAAPSAAPSKPAPAAADAALEKAGQTAAHAWLLLLDRRDWGTAWDSASGVFRQNVPLATWMDGIPKVREPLGAFIERQPAEVVYKKTLPGQPAGDYVTAIFLSKFEKKEQVQEQVTTVREPGGRWRVTGYSAR